MSGGGIDGSGSARRNAHEKILKTCACGRVLCGNLATSHLRTCEQNLRERGWPLPSNMKEAIRDEYRIGSANIIQAVERKLGDIYLARRTAGDKSEMRWIEFRDLVWQLADEVSPVGH